MVGGVGRTFTMLARSTNCTFVNRDLLTQWILRFKGNRADERTARVVQATNLQTAAPERTAKAERDKENSQFGLLIFLCCLLIFVLIVHRASQKREVKQQITYSTPTPTPEPSESSASLTTLPYATPKPALVPMLFDKTTGLYSPITDHHSKDQIEIWENPDLIKDAKYIRGNSESTPTP
jgi:hypothetical protein